MFACYLEVTMEGRKFPERPAFPSRRCSHFYTDVGSNLSATGEDGCTPHPELRTLHFTHENPAT